jgi:enterochelin esterase family protein
VQIDIGGKKYDLKKDEKGVWTGESDPQDVGFHYYQLNIDGASVPDPGSLYYFGASRWGSGIEIPSKDQDFFALKNVPHGMLRETFYFSKTTNSVRRVYIYTPPGYDKDTKSYPVLYLQHGMGEDETGWGSQGYTGMIMDNLIAEGKATPFIIVMENSGGAPRGPRPAGAPQGPGAPQGAPAGAPGQGGPGAGPRPGGPMGGMNMAGQFERILFDDLIPYIESNFRVIADQEHRAMAGLSMGGMQTRSIVIANPDKFSYVGMFSSGTFVPTEIKDLDVFKKKGKLVFMSFGGKEGGAARIPAAAEEWNKIGIKGVSYVSPETAHEWHSWRRSLHEFAPLIFKN